MIERILGLEGRELGAWGRRPQSNIVKEEGLYLCFQGTELRPVGESYDERHSSI